MAEPSTDTGAISIAQYAGILAQPSAAEPEPVANPAPEPAPVEEDKQPVAAEPPEPEPQEEESDEPPLDDDAQEEEGDEPPLASAPDEFEVETADGVRKVTRDELVKSYLRQEDYTRKTQAIAETSEQLKTKFSQYETEAINRLNALEERLTSEYQQVALTAEQWEGLKQHDPQAYLLKREEMRERETQIMAARQERDSRHQQITQLAEQERLQAVQRNDALLADRIPEWKDPVKKAELQTQIIGYLENAGFNQNEINGITDARAIEVALDAMKWRALQKEKPLIAKKVATAPRMAKPGAGTDKGDMQRVNLEAARKKLRSSGKVSDFAKLIVNQL